MKLALAVITRDIPEDTVLLDRLLDNLKDTVDGIFITNTTKNGTGGLDKIAEKYGAHVSFFNWIDDFAAARNFNFSQVPEEYDYIMWSDTDDMWRGLDKLKENLDYGKDGYAFMYLYEFDENKQPVVSHKKTMIVKNDGSFTWKGAIHEDLDADREVSIGYVEGIERMHFTNEVRITENRERNERIAAKTYEENKDDPRNSFNYGNALIGVGKYQKARELFEEFLVESKSEDEKYLIRQRLAMICNTLGDVEMAEQHLLMCIGIQPTWPDAYFQLGQFYFDLGRLEKAESYLLKGLVLKPSYHSMIVFNPRDYDYNPMNLLAKVYFRKNRPDLALPLLEGCLKIMPGDEKTKALVKEMRKEVGRLQKILDLLETFKQEKDDEKLKKMIDDLPREQRSHPGICSFYNSKFAKKESSGKDVVFYCGYTDHEWNPELFRTKGFGGSEEAIIHLSNHFSNAGFNVEVYANVGTKRIVENGVTWKPFWEFNSQDVVDHLILWRSPKLCDYVLQAKHVYIDVHDVISPGEFTKKRLDKIDKIFVKTKFHKSLFPKVPEEKFAVIPNGINIKDFAPIEKDPMLIINTSSPDRSMEATAEIFKRVRKEVPEAKLFWAYGWDVFDGVHSDNPEMQDWKNQLVKKMEDAGVFQMGKIPQHEIAKLYEKASIMLYPTEFAEIDCISVKKAQLAGCKVITTDFGALEESVQTGVKIHSEKTSETWNRPYQFSFGVEDEKQIQQFADETVKALKNGIGDTTKAREFGRSFEWESIGDNWIKNLCA